MMEKKVAKLPAGFKTKLGDIYRFLKEYFSLPADFLYDYFIYAGQSGTFRTGRTQKTLQAYIIRLYHGIEVGLSYPDPKPGFGVKTVKRLLKALEKFENKFGFDYYAKIALNVLFLNQSHLFTLARKSTAKIMTRPNMRVSLATLRFLKVTNRRLKK